MVCVQEDKDIRCFFKRNSAESFNQISYNFEKECKELKSYYFNEKNEFILLCKKSNDYYIYIFNENNMNKNKYELNIKIYRLIYTFVFKYTLFINNYDFVYDGNFTETCENFNNAEIPSSIQENKDSSYFFFSDKTIEEKTTHSYIDEVDFQINSSIIEKSDFYNTNEEINTEQNIIIESLITDSSNEIRITHFSEYFKISDTLTQEKEHSEEIELITNNKDNEFIIQTQKIIEIKTDVKEEETKLLKEQIINNITSIIGDKEIGKSYEITGKGFTIKIKPTNSTSFQNSTHIDFDDCERVLRNKYNISNSSIITFLQMEIENNDKNSLYNQIKYFTYDDKKQELDLNLCNNITTQIHYNIKEDSNLDIISINDFNKKGIDIFNIKDEFFNNICNSFSDSDNDMILEDRIKYIFQNYSLCEDGCSYNNFDLEKMSITCDCKIQVNFNKTIVPLIFEQGKEASFLDSNIGVIKCYNLVLKLNNKLDNLGFILFAILILMYIIFLFSFIIKGIKTISDFVFNEMVKYGYLNKNKNGKFEVIINKKPKKIEITTSLQKRKKKTKDKKKKRIKMFKIGKEDIIKTNYNDDIIKDNKASLTSNFNFENSNKNIRKQKSRKLKKNFKNKDEEDIDNFGIIKININENIKNYFPKESNQSLYNYTIEEAQRYDKRNIIRIFYIYLLSKQIIFHTFLLKSPLELFSLRFTSLIFIFACDLALNALFYFNDNISKKYHYAKNIFIFALSNNITIILYSILVTYFFMILMTLLSNLSNSIRNVFRKEEQKLRMKTKKKYIIDDKKKKEIYLKILNIFRKYKIKLLFHFFFQIILILFFWYFVTAFCHVYSSTQSSWLLDSFLSILSRFFFEIIFGFLFAKLYRIAVSSNVKTLYKIVMCIYDFS